MPRRPHDPGPLQAKLQIAKEQIEKAAREGKRIRAYEIAIDLDISEFHFARKFREAFGESPHRYYDGLRATRARELLKEDRNETEVARKIGLRRPAELRALLHKHCPPTVRSNPGSMAATG